ncbi:hypothetical protein [Amycolatopsis thermophila]|uniref:Uncharacterized protein n=1 Tax=Amycolatopsis thermophila TaxID=206084 RepID=A0ABU0EN21_9PSEU|nr:hypothetical protein [Amycolatopsis thermophila]MDQ0376431.1 hypothetical protein [Amycolatopsis thermophila]
MSSKSSSLVSVSGAKRVVLGLPTSSSAAPKSHRIAPGSGTAP